MKSKRQVGTRVSDQNLNGSALDQIVEIEGSQIDEVGGASVYGPPAPTPPPPPSPSPTPGYPSWGPPLPNSPAWGPYPS